MPFITAEDGSAESAHYLGLADFLTRCVILKFAGERFYWKPPPDKATHRITLPVEVKTSWKDMVAQAATYARCMFGASPMRTFALVLAFNHNSNTLRFLVFHRGGLTASDGCHTAERDGLKEIARLFLTLALWRTAEEAGAVGCCSYGTYLLPADKECEMHVSAAVPGYHSGESRLEDCL